MNSKKIVFVNNTAATSGGALTILIQFIENVAINFDENYVFYIFCTVDLKQYNSQKIKIINNIKGKSWKNRILWDLRGLKKWSKEKSIYPDLLISLQNTGIYGFNNVPQVIYLHQSLPYYKDAKWSLLKAEERSLWIYKHIYRHIIGMSIRNNYIIVQTEWMKKIVSDMHKVKKDKIYVIPPSIKNIDIKNVNNIKRDGEIMIFYPSIPVKYKNHKVLLEAIKLLKKENKVNNLKLILTIDKSTKYSLDLYEYLVENNLQNEVKFIGKVSYKEVLEYYKASDIVVYPSYVETYGLPLIEAAQFKKNIIVSDLDYAREALKGYEGVKFVNYKDKNIWAKEILNLLSDTKTNYNYKNENIDSWNHMKNLIVNIIN